MSTENTSTQESKPSENQNTSTQESKPSENQNTSTQESKPSGNQNTSTQESRPSGNRDTIFIGKKPIMAYVTSTLIQLANYPEVKIKARGMSIGRAVDVAQIILRKTENAGYVIGDIKISSEVLESNDGKTRNVSTIEIPVKSNK